MGSRLDTLVLSSLLHSLSGGGVIHLRYYGYDVALAVYPRPFSRYYNV
jgi:hypothetical protein